MFVLVEDNVPVTFYFDESNHDRKIRICEDAVLNVWKRDRFRDKYVGCFVGWPDSDLRYVECRYLEFEKAVRKLFKFSVDKEIKSELVKDKKYRCGLASFNGDSLFVYERLFMFLSNTEVIWQVNIASKIDVFLRNGAGFRNFLNQFHGRAILYTFEKFFDKYADNNLMSAVLRYCDGEIQDYQFVREIVRRLDTVIACNKGIMCKRTETAAYRNLKQIFKRYRPLIGEKCVNFDYDVDGFGLLSCVGEYDSIGRDVSVFVDKELHTCESIRKCFDSVTEVDSVDCFGVRVADMLVGFISRMLISISAVLSEPVTDFSGGHGSNDRCFIPVGWFDLQRNPRAFDLYHLVADVLIGDDLPYWTVCASIFGDEVSILFSLLRYMSNFSDFDAYNAISPYEHCCRFNVFALNELDARIDELA